MLIITPYQNCHEVNKHVLTRKAWLLVYIFICLGNFLRDSINKKIDKMYNEGQITYRQRKYLKMSIWIGCELVNLVW